MKRVMFVKQGDTCVVTDHTIPGARVLATMRADRLSLEVGKSRIQMSLTKEKDDAKAEDPAERDAEQQRGPGA